MCTMNKIYKVIWSKVKACYVVVSELAKRHSKCKSAKPAISLAALVTAFMLTAGHGVVYATDLAPTDNVGKIGAITIDSSKVDDSKFSRIVNIDGFIIDNSVQNYGTFSQYMQNIYGRYNQVGTNRSDTLLGLDGGNTALGCLTLAGIQLERNEIKDADGNVINVTYATELAPTGGARFKKADGHKDYGYATALGFATAAAKTNAIATGHYTVADGLNAFSGGSASMATNDNAFAFGRGVLAAGANSFAFGEGWRRNPSEEPELIASGKNSVAMGDSTKAFGKNSVALGHSTKASGQDSVALNGWTEAKGDASLAAGNSSKALADNSTALSGGLVSADAKNAAAIGKDASAQLADSVALGSKSIADRAGFTRGYNPKSGAVYASDAEIATVLGKSSELETLNTTIDAQQATYNEKKAAYDTAKAAYYNNQDGTLSGQLYDAWSQAATELNEATRQLNASQEEKRTMLASWKSGVAAVSVGDASTGRTRQITGVAAGSEDTDAVNVAQLKALSGKVDEGAVHYYSVKSDQQGAGTNYANDGAKAADSMVIGISSSISEKAKNSTVLGNNNTLSNQPNARGVERDGENNSIVVGQNLTVEGARNAVFGTDYQNGTDKLLTHVAGERNTVIGVGNLVGYTAERVGTEWKYTKFKGHGDDENVVVGLTNTVNGGGVVVGTNTTVSAYGGVAFGHHNTVSGDEDKGVALGNDLNVSGYGALAVGTESAATEDYTIALGVESKAQALMAASMGYDSQAKASGSVALGAWSSAEAKQALALGYDSQAMVAGGVALGAKSVANRGKDVLGYDPVTGAAFANDAAVAAALGKTAELTAAETNIANAQTAVTAAQQAYDADQSDANKQALRNAKNTLNTAKSKKNELLASYKSVFGAVSVGRNDGTRQITNLAAGTEDTDAVNVAQLKALSGKVDEGAVHYFSVAADDSAKPENTNWNNDGATGAKAIAIGRGAKADGKHSIALGSDGAEFSAPKTTGEAAIAIGSGAEAGVQDISIGLGAKATGGFGVAIGRESEAKASTAVAMAYGAKAEGANSLAIGILSDAKTADSAAYGREAKALGAVSLAVGMRSKAGADHTAVFGAEATTDATAWNGTAIGRSAYIGKQAPDGTTPNIGVSNNYFTPVDDDTVVAPGKETMNSTAVGFGAKAFGYQDTALGAGAEAFDTNTVSIGVMSKAIGHYANALGKQARAEGKDSVAIGHWARSIGESSMALGDYAITSTLDGITSVTKSAAIGSHARAASDNSVALGANSLANIADDVATKAYLSNEAFAKENGVVSVGNEEYKVGDTTVAKNYRRITNVAGGAADNDAVNVAQLKALSGKVDEGAVHYFSVNSASQGTDSNYDNKGAVAADSIAIGPDVKTTGKNNIYIGVGTPVTPPEKRVLNGERNLVVGHGNVFDDSKDSVGTSVSYRDTAVIGHNNTLLKGSEYDSGGQYSPVYMLVHGWNNTLKGSFTGAIGKENEIKNSSRLNRTSQALAFAIGSENTVDGTGYYMGDKNRINTLEDYKEPGSNPNVTGADLYVVGRHNIVGSSKGGDMYVDNGHIFGSENVVYGYGDTVTGELNKVNANDSVTLGRGNSVGIDSAGNKYKSKDYPDFLIRNAVTVGDTNYVTADEGMVFGKMSEVNNDTALAVGYNNKANGKLSTVVGYENDTAKPDMTNAKDKTSQASSVFGFRNYTSGMGSVAVGSFNNRQGDTMLPSGNYSSAMGYNNNAAGESSSAMGAQNKAYGKNSSAMGKSNLVNGDYSVAVGTYNNRYDTATGKWKDSESGKNSSAVGVKNAATGEYSNAVGSLNTSSKNYSSAIGSNNTSDGLYANAVGYSNTAGGKYSFASGAANQVSGDYSSGAGAFNVVKGDKGQVFGLQNYVSGYGAVAFGYQNNQNFDKEYNSVGFSHTGDLAVALGNSNATAGDHSIGVGFGNRALGWRSLAVGNGNVTTGYESIAIGQAAFSGSKDETKINEVKRSVALGSLAASTLSDAVAVGSFSTTARDKGEYGYNPALGRAVTEAEVTNDANIGTYRTELENAKTVWQTAYDASQRKLDEIQTHKWTTQEEYNALVAEFEALKADTQSKYLAYDAAQKKVGNLVGTWQGQLAAVSVGDASTGRTRQITGVAAGSEDTDAVNVAQLKALSGKVDEGAVHYFSVNADDSAAPAGTNWNNDGAKSTGSIAVGQKAQTLELAIDSVKTPETISSDHAVALGSDASAAGKGSVAIGKNAVTGTRYATTPFGMVLTMNIAGDGAVAVGDSSQAATEGSVAVGRNAIAGRYEERLPEKKAYGIAIGDGAKAVGAAGQNTAGADKDDAGLAVGMQAYAAGNGTITMGYKAHAENTQNIIIGSNATTEALLLPSGSKTVHPISSIGIGADAVVKGRFSVAIGTGASVGNGQMNLSTGYGFLDFGGVALGYKSQVDRPGSVGLGSWTRPWRQGDQAAEQTKYAHNKNVIAPFSGQKLYFKDDIGSAQVYNTMGKNSVVNGVVSVGGVYKRSTGGGEIPFLRQIINVADGTEDTDAVNLRQLKAVNDKLDTTSTTAGTALQSWDAQIGGTKVKTVDKDHNTLNFVAGKNVSLTNDSENIKIATSDDVDFNKVTVGDTVINGNGLSITGGPAIAKDGIKAGDKNITNLAAGTADTDAVNVAQLKAVDKKVAVVFDDKKSLMSIDAKINHKILEHPDNFPEGEGQSIALGKGAYAYMQEGRKAQGILFGMKKATGAIAIGENAKALSHSIAIGNRLYAGDMGDVKISPSDYNVENGSGVASTLLGNNSYAGGTLSTLVGSYSIMSTSYPGGHQKAYMQNAGAVSVGALNSIESATAKQGTSFFGKLPDDKSSGVANSVVGLANRAYNANGALIYGAGNEITNSIASVKAPAAAGSVKAAAENLRKAIKTNPGGAVLAIGGGNKADLAVRSQLIGVANTLTGTSETPSEYNMLDGFNNTGTNVKHITLMGSENTVSDTTGAILLGDKRKLTGANGSIVLGVADTEKELTVKDAVLIGHNADVQKAGGVALGAGSVASVDKDVAGYDPSTGAASTKTGSEWKSTLAAVSVGNADNTRQITNVAAGFEDTDAVNVAQLKAVKTSVTGNATDIAALKGGFTVSNAAGAKQNITLGDATKQNIMFQGEENTIDVDVAHASDGATVTVKANAKLGENIDLSNNNTITTINNNIETLKGGFKVKSDSVTGEIKAGDTLEFAGKNHVETTYDKTLKTLTIGLDDATKNKIDNINTTINAAAKWTIQDSESTPGSKTIDAATPLVVQGADGVTAKVDDAGLHLGIDASKIDLSSNTTVTNITNNLSRGFELRAGTESTGAKIALDGDKRPAIRFDVAATDKGLTVTRDENTVKYGIDGSKIDLTGNTAITNITSNLAQASAWKLQVNGKNERTIGKDNVVNFINGEYTEVTAEGSNKVKIDLNKAAKDKLDTLEGKIKANKVQVTGDAATGVKVAGTQENDGSTTYKVSLGEKIQVGGVTMDGAGDNRTITGLTNTSLDVAGFATSQRAATEEQLQAAMTQMSANAKITTVESGDENIVVNKTEGQNENKYTVALNKNLNVDSLNAGGTQVNKDGISVRGADGKPGVTITKNGIDAGNKKITNVADGVDAHDAATVGQLGKLAEDAGKGLNELGNQISKLDGRVNKVGAGAAALAAMHPLDFDPDDKWNVSAGYGSYKGSHAGAIGAFYRPDENTMFNIGASVGGGENMVNAGVTFALDRKSHITTSRTAMAREIMDLRKEITELKAARANGNWMLDPEMTKLFPDVPENHWAYEYIAKLAGNGIIKGYPDGSFAGNRMMTRYEFAALLYRAMENGANVDARALKEFAPEMGRIRVDRVYGKDNDRNKIERVRVNNENTQERDTYGSKIQIAAK